MSEKSISKVNFKNEHKLRNLYYDPKFGYKGVESLYRKALEDGLLVTRKQIRSWLKTQDTYTRYKKINKSYKTQKTFMKNLREQLQLHLVDMSKLRYKTKNFSWILTGVKILSRFTFAIPVKKKDTQHMTKAVSKLLQEFDSRFSGYPEKVQFDEGKEYYNVRVKSVLEKNNILYFSTHSERKAAIVERFNRTLKTIMWKYFYSKGTYDWIDVLDSFVYNYNHTKHSTILMRPAEVTKNNSDQVWLTLYGHWTGQYSLPRYKIGEKVRVSKYKNFFEKGYEANFTEEIFEIYNVFRRDPNTYEIKEANEGSSDDEPVLGKFYKEELSPVDKKEGEAFYRVEKVLKTRGNMALVKWLGYDQKHNSWVKKSDIKNL